MPDPYRNGPKQTETHKKDRNTQKIKTGTNRKGQKLTETDSNKKKQKETDRNGQKQTETEKNGQKPTKTGHKQKWTDPKTETDRKKTKN